MQKPWFWKARKRWYVNTPDGRVPLGETEEEAYDEWQRLRTEAAKSREKDPAFQQLADAFGAFAERQFRNGEIKIKALNNYAFYLERFCRIHGQKRISELLPHHVTDWLNSQPGWGPSAQRHAIGSIKRVLNWATDEERRIGNNPLSGMKRPTPRRREQLVEEDVHKRIVLAAGAQKGSGRIDRRFRLALVAVRQCGGRPQDVANVRVEHVDREITKWTIPEHKTRRHTERPRIVYLTPCLRTITLMLLDGRKSGPLFRGRRGKLSTNAISCRIKRLRRELGIEKGVVTYSYRHTYITDALERGVDVATVAELVGTSVEMIQKHYGHLSARHDHLKSAALKAVRKPR